MSEEQDSKTYIIRLSDHADFIKWALENLNVPENLADTAPTYCQQRRYPIGCCAAYPF